MTDIWAQAIARRFRENGERVFIIDAIGGGELTYAALLGRAAGAVLDLRRRGLKAGDRIGINMPNGVDFVILYFACLLGGFTAVPINNALSVKDRAFILSSSRLAILVAADASEAGLRGLFGVDDLSFLPPVLTLAGADRDGLLSLDRADAATADGLLDGIDTHRLFSIHFTSGTTSLPKGVPHRVAGLLANADAFNRMFGIGPNNRFVHVMPMPYMAGFLNTVLEPFMAGGSLVLAPQFTAQSVLRFWDPIIAHKVNTIWVSPTMLVTLTKIDRNPQAPAYCRDSNLLVLSATAPLPLKTRQDFEVKYGVTVVESYGLSELLLITANLGPAGSKANAVGRWIPEAAVEVRNADGHVLPLGQDGEIYVSTPHATVGYLDYESGEPGRLDQAWFPTGDVGHVDADGYLFVTGRKKDLIIRGGFNVSPRAIEELLLVHPGVEDVAVVGAPHAFYGEEVVAVVIVKKDVGLPAIEAELGALCRRDLGPTYVPDRFVAVPAFPVSTTGKVQKNVLRDQLAALPA